MQKILLSCFLFLALLLSHPTYAMASNQKEIGLSQAWSNLNNVVDFGPETSEFLKSARTCDIKELLDLLCTEKDPNQWMAVVMDALSKRITELTPQELLDAYFSCPENYRITTIIGTSEDKSLIDTLVKLWDDPRVANEPNHELFVSTLPLALSSEKQSDIEKFFDFVLKQPYGVDYDQWENEQKPISLAKHADLLKKIVNLDSPYSQSITCVAIAFTSLLPLAPTDQEVRDIASKYLRTKALRNYDIEENMGLLFIISLYLDAVQKQNPNLTELESIIRVNENEIGKDDAWEEKISPFIKTWLKQSKDEPDMRKENVEAAISVAKTRYALSNPKIPKGKEEVSFEELKGLVLNNNEVVQSLEELEDYAGFKILSLGGYYNLEDPDTQTSSQGIKWGEPKQ